MRRLARQGAGRFAAMADRAAARSPSLAGAAFAVGGGGGAFAAAFSLCWAFFASLACFLAKAFCAFLDMGLSPPSAAGLAPAAAAGFFSAAAFFFAAFLVHYRHRVRRVYFGNFLLDLDEFSHRIDVVGVAA